MYFPKVHFCSKFPPSYINVSPPLLFFPLSRVVEGGVLPPPKPPITFDLVLFSLLVLLHGFLH